MNVLLKAHWKQDSIFFVFQYKVCKTEHGFLPSDFKEEESNVIEDSVQPEDQISNLEEFARIEDELTEIGEI